LLPLVAGTVFIYSFGFCIMYVCRHRLVGTDGTGRDGLLVYGTGWGARDIKREDGLSYDVVD
jgi:hypothetical protein